jgi:RNA polymerase sigma factor (sigma-70 family)
MFQPSGRTGGRVFPTTRRSVLEATRDEDGDVRRAAFDALIAVYWRPIYTYLRIKWRAQPADAEDLAQEFFARAVIGGFFDDYDPARARFRTFLRTCVDRFAANARRNQRRLKRGGGVKPLPLDFAAAERGLTALRATAAPEADGDVWFDREWVRSLFAEAVDALRAGCLATPREIRFLVFERYDLAPADGAARPGYKALAQELGLSVAQVTNHLAWARKELRRLVLERLELLSGSDSEFRAEAEDLFGVRIP